MNKKVLIIEDEPALSSALIQKMEKEGFDVFHALDGKNGLDVALREHPDVIILDILMPKMDGIAVLDTLRKDDWGRNARVIILSNLASTEYIDKAKAYNIESYTIKADTTLDEIVEQI